MNIAPITPKQLVTALLAKVKPHRGVTLDAGTGELAPTNYWAVGGMIQAFGEFNSLYYSPTGKPDRNALEAHLTTHWDAIQTVGYIGAWKTEGGELFIDSIFRVPCGCDTLGGKSPSSAKFAERLAHSNHQEAIAHICDVLVEDEPLTLIYN
jgi:hypothetical protein